MGLFTPCNQWVIPFETGSSWQGESESPRKHMTPLGGLELVEFTQQLLPSCSHDLTNKKPTFMFGKTGWFLSWCAIQNRRNEVYFKAQTSLYTDTVKVYWYHFHCYFNSAHGSTIGTAVIKYSATVLSLTALRWLRLEATASLYALVFIVLAVETATCQHFAPTGSLVS